jgi:N-methylhydantoinase A
MVWRIGIDSGGTFTDVCLFNEEDGQVQIWKVSSTPDDPSRAIAQGIAEGMERVGSPRRMSAISAMARRWAPMR